MAKQRHVRITVFPESGESRVEAQKESAGFNVYVRSAAVSGAANKEAIHLLREFLDVGGQIRIVSGHRRPQKIISITN